MLKQLHELKDLARGLGYRVTSEKTDRDAVFALHIWDYRGEILAVVYSIEDAQEILKDLQKKC